MLLWRAPMMTEKVQTMVAPQPPRLSTEPPRAVSRKLGLASATTKPSNQLIALISSRSSTEATAMTPPSSGLPGVRMQYAREAAVKGTLARPRGGTRIGAPARATLLCSAGGRRPGRLNEHALEAA